MVFKKQKNNFWPGFIQMVSSSGAHEEHWNLRRRTQTETSWQHFYCSVNVSKPRRCTRHSVPACVSHRQCPSMIQSCSYFRARGDTIALVLSQQRVKQAQTTERSSVLQSRTCHAESQSLQRFSLK